MIPTKEMTPLVPVSVDEIVEQTHEAYEIGITMVHIHARDHLTGKPTYKAEIYEKIISEIRKYAHDTIICVSLSGRDFCEFEKRAEPLTIDGDAKPDMGSLTLSSLNFNKQASINEPDMIIKLASEMKKRNIKPELEAFDIGMVNFAHYLIRKDLLSPPYYFNLLFGNIACAQAELLQAGVMVKELPENSYWSFAGIGDYQFRMNSVAIAMGRGIRIGLEDNIWFDQIRTRLASNSDLLKRAKNLADANERKIMTGRDFRCIFGLSMIETSL